MDQAKYQVRFAGPTNAGSQIGVNSGHVENHYHSGAVATILPPSPTIVLPFRRDRDFVELPVLQKIWQCTSQPAARVGIVGLGGVGKTQLAIEYAYRCRDANPQLWVFWVYAGNNVRFEESYRQIAQQVGISSWADPKTDVLKMVYAWLVNGNNGQWTMVVDNADNGDVLFQPHGGSHNGDTESSTMAAKSSDRMLADYLPSVDHGSIVITSRSRGVAAGLIEYADDIFDIDPMSQDDGAAGVTLLTKKLKKSHHETNQDQMTRLVKELDYMPLAITQAAAYINQLSPRMTVTGYLDLLVESDIGRDRLLRQDIRDPRRDGRASNSIIMTWHTSFEHIRQTRDSAARLLALMSLFDRAGIPQNLLCGEYNSTDQDQKGQGEEKFDFEEDLMMLQAYSLINIGTNEQLFEMHRLVQFSTRKWLEIHDRLGYWLGRYTDILYSVFPTGQYVNWLTCQVLFPHVTTMMSHGVVNNINPRKRALVLYRGAGYAWQSGRYEIARQMATTSLEIREHSSDCKYKEILKSVHMLALVLQSQGKYDEAEQMIRRALAEREEKLGESHPDTLVSVENLASVLRDRGKYGEAEQLSRRALAEREEKLGESHRHTLRCVNALAVVLQSQWKYDEAEQLSRRALKGHEKELGESHPDTLVSVDNLASVLQSQGKYGEAEQLSRRALKGHEKELGESHPHTLKNINNLSIMLRDQGKYDEAEQMIRRALAGREKELGNNHPSTLLSVSSLATVLEIQGRYAEAEQLNRRALAGREKELGDSHPATLMSVSNLALVLHGQRKYTEAEHMYRRALAGYKKELGDSYPEMLRCEHNLACLLHEQKDHKEALRLYDRAIRGYENVLGPSHPDTVACKGHKQLLLQEFG